MFYLVMRIVLAAAITSALLSLTGTSFADVGPAPKCPAGQHSEYLYGRHCVPDGSHLEKDANNKVIVVADQPQSNPTTQPTSNNPQYATPPPNNPNNGANSNVPPSAPPPNRGCACTIENASNQGSLAILFLIAGAVSIPFWRRQKQLPFAHG